MPIRHCFEIDCKTVFEEMESTALLLWQPVSKLILAKSCNAYIRARSKSWKSRRQLEGFFEDLISTQFLAYLWLLRVNGCLANRI
jgi:hypothetical protein